MELPYFVKLIEIRKFLELELEGFPYNKCQDSTRILKLTLGLEEIAGKFKMPGTSKKHDGHQWHAWSFDKKYNIYIDLTINQFGRYDPISIIPLRNSLIIPMRSRTKEQRMYQTKITSPNLKYLFPSDNNTTKSPQVT